MLTKMAAMTLRSFKKILKWALPFRPAVTVSYWQAGADAAAAGKAPHLLLVGMSEHEAEMARESFLNGWDFAAQKILCRD